MNIYISKINGCNKNEIKDKLIKYAYREKFKKEIDLSKIVRNKYGKPYYDNKFFFNISHSSNYICIAVASSEVGIDIEENRKIEVDISKRILGENEKVIDNNIIINWAIKEAYSKYKGLGFYIDFRNINAEQLLKDNNLKNLSTDKYYCYLYGDEKLEKVKYIERI